MGSNDNRSLRLFADLLTSNLGGRQFVVIVTASHIGHNTHHLAQTMTDTILRLQFPDGRVLLCPKSTLVNGGGYFASRFCGSLPSGGDLTDSVGNALYYVPRDGELFQKYILPFLFKNTVYLPEFTQDPVLWRKLRDEADFFCLHGLQEKLKVTHSVSLNPQGKGVLYWLGTGKGAHEYKNPFDINQVEVGGWVDELKGLGIDDICGHIAGTKKSRRVLVQHRPPVKVPSQDVSDPNYHILEGQDPCYLLWCDHAAESKPVVVDLKSICLRLTAYSLRFDSCCGMTWWRFEGSNDGTKWDLLHEARGDKQIKGPSIEEKRKVYQAWTTSNEETRVEALLDYTEQNHRGLWKMDRCEFYQYFRFIGFGDDDDDVPFACMHGTGLELYGDIHEI